MNKNLDKLTDLHKKNLIEIVDLKNKLESSIQEGHDLFINIVLDIIDVIDTFEKAEEVILDKGLGKAEGGSKIMERYKSVNKKLSNILHKHGITKIEFPENRLIVGFCKVVDTEPDQAYPNDTILSIVRNGYHRGKELIRESEVIIVKN